MGPRVPCLDHPVMYPVMAHRQASSIVISRILSHDYVAYLIYTTDTCMLLCMTLCLASPLYRVGIIFNSFKGVLCEVQTSSAVSIKQPACVQIYPNNGLMLQNSSKEVCTCTCVIVYTIINKVIYNNVYWIGISTAYKSEDVQCCMQNQHGLIFF